MRKAAVSCGIIGLILLVAAGLMAWWITPSYIARLPSDYNKTRTYTGTIKSLLNPAAVATGNLAAAIRTGLPATLTDNVLTQQTSGNTALIQDHRTISTSGTKVASTTWHYAVNRQTLEATSSHPSNWSVTPAKGLTVSWPFGAKKQNYTGWVPLTHTTTPLKYVTQAQQGGITTYEYHATVPPTRITDRQSLAGLPTSLPVALVPRLAAAGLITPSQVSGLSAAFPRATTIPLGYTYQASNNYFVDPNTGLVINVSNNESEVGGILLPTGTIIPILPVLAYSYHATPASLSAAANDASNGNSVITTLGVSLPITAAVIGFLLLVLAVLLWMRGRSRGRPVEVEHGERHPSPAGRIS
jgi:Porin PorA